MPPPSMQKPLSPNRFLLLVFGPFSVAILLFYLLMRPPFNDFRVMTIMMGISAISSAALAYIAYRSGWISQFPRLLWAIISVNIFSGFLVFLNVWIIARLMFASPHDLLLATILLIFAVGIASVLAILLSFALAERIGVLSSAADKLAMGNFSTRVAIEGRDEIAKLTETFNNMASELELSQQRQQDMESQRRDLVAWVGHDLRTPLTSIRAILEALADGVVEDQETTLRYLQTAQQDVRSLSSLIDDLFELSQVDAGGMQPDIQPASLGDLISDTIESFNAIASRQMIHLTGRIDPDVDPIRMDTRLIGRVLANLTSNALRHTPSGGQVRIEAVRNGEHVCIDISDTGEGIQAEDLPHIFERFYRGDKARTRSSGGAGLGLAIAAGIVKAHQGTIKVESTRGKGATFLIELPA